MKARLVLSLALALWACDSKSKASDVDPAPAPQPEPPEQSPGKPTVEPWTPNFQVARFYALASGDEKKLELSRFAVKIRTHGPVATTTLDVSVSNPNEESVRAHIELPIPPGAAVTRATLWVDDRPKPAVLVDERTPLVGSAGGHLPRPNLLQVEWFGAEAIHITLQSIPAHDTQRFSVTWVEPSVGDRHWIPSFRNDKEVVGYPHEIELDGKRVRAKGSWLAVSGKTSGADGDYEVRVSAAKPPASLAIVLDTSNQSNDQQIQWTRFSTLVESLDGAVDVHLVAGDWLALDLGAGQRVADFAAAETRFMSLPPAGIFDDEHVISHAAKLVADDGAVVVIGGVNKYSSALGVPVYWTTTIEPPDRPAVAPTDDAFEWLPLDAASGQQVWIGRRRDAKPPAAGAALPAMAALFARALARSNPNDEHIHGIVAQSASLVVAAEKSGGGAQIDSVQLGPGAQGGSLPPDANRFPGRAIGRRSRVRLRMNRFEVAGDLDRAVIRRYVRRHLRHLQACYERALERSPTLQGELRAKFTIEPNGAVRNASAKLRGSGTKDLTDCFSRRFSAIQFPRVPKGGRVVVNVTFELAGSPAQAWSAARAIVETGGRDVASKVAALFGGTAPGDRTDLAWRLRAEQLVPWRSPPDAYVTIASLVDRSTDEGERAARRLLSEGCPRYASAIAEVFRKWGFDDDARRAETFEQRNRQ